MTLRVLIVMGLAFSFFELMMAALVAPESKTLIWEIRSLTSLILAAVFWCTDMILCAIEQRR